MAQNTLELFRLDPFNDGKLMEGIFYYQKNLLNNYISRDMIPAWPIDLDNRDNQKFIRETMGWLVEEMAEAAEEYDKVMDIFKNNVYTLEEVQKEIKAILPKLTEELMDVTHFFIELLHYSHIGADDMLGYYKQRLEMEGYNQAFMTPDALTTAMMYARHLNINSDEARISFFNAFKVETFDHQGYVAALSMELPADKILAGTRLGIELAVYIERVYWSIVQLVYKAKNRLKNKYWKSKETQTNIQAYQEELMNAWVAFTVLLDLFNLSAKAIYYHYEQKNLINQERILTSY